jgi:hypothetical protein
MGSLIKVANELSRCVTFNGNTSRQVGKNWHQTCRQMYLADIKQVLKDSDGERDINSVREIIREN